MTILEAKHLSKTFHHDGLWQRGKGKKAVVDVSLNLQQGTTLAIVGESGSGKSTLARLIMQLLPADQGEVILDGTPLHSLNAAAMRRQRRYIQMVFQDPFASLNPRMKISSTIAEGLRIHHPQLSKQQRRDEIARVLAQCGIAAELMDRYPHQFSGGQRQRIGIARALVVDPKVLVLDEPVSALDVSVQAQILNLLKQLQQALGLAYVFISHDLSVVRHISDQLMVMFAGQVVEQGATAQVFTQPRHPYTQSLLAAIPLAHPSQRQIVVDAQPEADNEQLAEQGCPFHPRCEYAQADCQQHDMQVINEGQHRHRCRHPLQYA